jgi:hypothetical protein
MYEETKRKKKHYRRRGDNAMTKRVYLTSYNDA